MSNSITSRIRKSRAAVSAILLAFVIGYLSPYMTEIGQNFFSPSKVHVGNIAGNIIPYFPDYRYRFDSMMRQEVMMNGHYEGIEATVHRKVWEKFILENAFNKTYDSLGIGVLSEEKLDMLLGNDVPKHIQDSPQFQDPKTRQFSKTKYLTILQNLADRPGGVEMWAELEKDLLASRLQDKLKFLIYKSIYKSRFYKRKEKQWQQSANVRYLYIPYHAVSTSLVRNKVNEHDKQAYYKANKKKYKQQGSKDMEYVVFPVHFSNEDVKKAQKELENLKKKFAQDENPESFAKLYSDSKEVVVQLEEDELPEYIKANLAKSKNKGVLVIGPIQEGDTCAIYRYMGTVSNGSWFKQSNKIVHRFVKIERKIAISENSNDQKMKEASEFVNKVKSTKKWKEVAEEGYGLTIYEATITKEHAQRIGDRNFGQVKRWLYNDAKPFAPSHVIQLQDGYYVVAIMTKERNAGIAPLAEVNDAVEKELFNDKKGDIIIENLTKIGLDLPLEKIAEAYAKTYGDDASIGEQTVCFEDNKLSDNLAPEAIGALFALQVGERTQCIKGETGIYIVQRLPNSNQNAKKTKNKEEEDKKIMTEELGTAMEFILKYQTLIQDKRYQFYD